jgi:hypothetical protein
MATDDWFSALKTGLVHDEAGIDRLGERGRPVAGRKDGEQPLRIPDDVGLENWASHCASE